MARHPRLVVPEVALHIRQRGNGRHDCFRREVDRLVFLSMLRDLAALHHCAIHAYCLMTNHIHLLATPQYAEGCALMMRDLGRCYSAYFNRHYDRTGALWEGPFRSCLVDSARYVLGCYRYIELNPVKAGMVASAKDYPWSSYAVNSGRTGDGLISPHAEYAALGNDAATRQAAYRALFVLGEDPDLNRSIRKATHAGLALVGDRLKSRLEGVGARLEPSRPGPRSHQVSATQAGETQLALLTK